MVQRIPWAPLAVMLMAGRDKPMTRASRVVLVTA